MAEEDDCNDVYICHSCVDDTFLKDEIRSEGRNRKCSFCGKSGKAWPLEELAERVQAVIEEHFKITPSDPRSEGFVYDEEMQWERRGDPVECVIAEIAGVEPGLAEAVRKRLSKMTSWDAFEGGYEDPFASDRYVRGRQTGYLRLPRKLGLLPA